MFVQEEPPSVQLLAVELGDKLEVLPRFIEPRSHALWSASLCVESLPCAEGRTHGRSDQEKGFLSSDHFQRSGFLALDVEIPRFAVEGIDARQVKREPGGQFA